MKIPAWVRTYKVYVMAGGVLIVVSLGLTALNFSQKGAARRQGEKDTQRSSLSIASPELGSASSPNPAAFSSPTPEIPTPTPTPTSTPSPSPSAKTSPKATTKPTATPTATPTPAASASNTTVTWNYTGSSWQPSGSAPSCPSPLTLNTPVDLSGVTYILYPGQVRGGDYKPHGGFRFDNSPDGLIDVRSPYEAVITQASRYIEAGEIQYLFEFQISCGIAFRFDHLRTLSSALQSVADTLPAAQPDDTRTTPINPPVKVSANQVLATQIGVTSNRFVDWGVYDLRTHNSITKSNNTLASYGVCWFDWISSADEATVRGLPATAGNSSSDYCN